MNIWFWLGPYLFAALIAARLIVGHLAYSAARHGRWIYPAQPRNVPTNHQWSVAIFFGVLLACIWPMVPIWIVLPSIGAERDAELRLKAAQQAERIGELEREAGL